MTGVQTCALPISFVGVTIVAGIVIFAIQGLRNRRAGIQTDLIYRALPPD